MIGKTISHYKILKELGRGGMGEVSLAEDTRLKRQVALKFLPRQMTADPEAKERFEREAQAAAALNHPNIVTVYEIGEHECQVFIAMEYVEGQTLKELISGSVGAYNHTPLPITHHPLPITQVIEIAIQISSGLAAAHAKGIVHRDVKPQNILIDKDNRVKILDFGLAKLQGSSRLTQESFAMGTVHYMSPEQGQGKEIDPRSDIWSLGVVFYEMTTSQLPFHGEYEAALIYSVLNEPPRSSPTMDNTPESLRRIVKKALAKSPEAHWQKISESIRGLEPVPKNPHTQSEEANPFWWFLYSHQLFMNQKSSKGDALAETMFQEAPGMDAGNEFSRE
jgi:serine/threonine protein kinase